ALSRFVISCWRSVWCSSQSLTDATSSAASNPGAFSDPGSASTPKIVEFPKSHLTVSNKRRNSPPAGRCSTRCTPARAFLLHARPRIWRSATLGLVIFVPLSQRFLFQGVRLWAWLGAGAASRFAFYKIFADLTLGYPVLSSYFPAYAWFAEQSRPLTIP